MPSQIMKKINMRLEKTFKNNQNIEELKKNESLSKGNGTNRRLYGK